MAGPEARVTLMLQDEALSDEPDALTQNVELQLAEDGRDRFVDGPASRRLGVVDFDPSTGAPTGTPVAFVPYPAGQKGPLRGSFSTGDQPHDSPAFIAVNAYGTAFQTIRMFEEAAAMGRPVEWAFGSEQLLIVPRAGEVANAFYHRASRSLQFFWFDSGGTRVYTALSRDIVAHECGHALLDAVLPSLFDSLTPESIAIHEAVADLVALLMALSSRPLVSRVLDASLDITDATAFSWIAERFGTVLSGAGKPGALRDLKNTTTVAQAGREPHELSTVLSGLFYDRFLSAYESLMDVEREGAPLPGKTGKARASWALQSCLTIFQRLILRGIDYLPPGELTFADVARACLAADLAGDPHPEGERVERRDEFSDGCVRRGIVANVGALATQAPEVLNLSGREQLVDLRDSDWAAYQFVEKHRAVIGVPAQVPFVVLSRIDATKQLGVKGVQDKSYPMQREMIMKVSWDLVEKNGSTVLTVPRRRLRTGATLAWRWSDGVLLALLVSDVDGDEQRERRDAMLDELLTSGAATVVDGGEHRQGAGDVAHVRVYDDTVRVTGTQALLHVAGARSGGAGDGVA